MEELLEVDLAVSIPVHQPYHLIDLFISNLLTQGVQNKPDLSRSNEPVSTDIKSEESVFDLLV